MGAERFKDAVEAGDLDAMIATMAPGIVFRSPVTFNAFEGRDAVRRLLAIIMRTFEDFTYVGTFEGATGTILHFRARVGDKQVEGIDMLHVDADGLIDDFTVMTRPLSATVALAEIVGPQLAAAGG